MSYVLILFAVILLADFISGLVHWWEDAYTHPNMPIFGKIAQNNLLHHHKPRAFLSKSWFESSLDLITIGVAVLALMWFLVGFNIWIFLFVLISVNANQFHKWTHQNAQERPKLVTLLQKLKLLQTPKQHGKHHSGQKNTYYCVITNLLNPVLERIGFWKGLEQCIEPELCNSPLKK